MTHTLLEDLDNLHDSYVAAINSAMTTQDLTRAEELAADYDIEAIALVAERGGDATLLQRPASEPRPRRRLRSLLGRLS